MANISRDTFNALKRYVSVRLQQGVPLVDADWNEQHDIRRFELRTFLKWFVGDGIPARVGDPEPQKNDSFRIAARTAPDNENDFTILAGGSEEALGAGRCLVDGVEVFITQNTTFVGQPLHEDYAGDETIVDPNALPIARVPVLGSAGTVLVYLDVWEWEIGGAVEKVPRDPELINDALGMETCVRLKRDWAVRVRPGTALPAPEDGDYLATHSYYALARIERRASDPAINPEDITDLRRTGITLTEYLKVPLYTERGTDVLDSQRLANLLDSLRAVFWERLENQQLFVSTGTEYDHDRTFVYLTVQNLTQICATGSLQARTHNLNNADALQVLRTLHDAQDAFLTALESHGDGEPTTIEFITNYHSRLNDVDTELAEGDLVGAYLEQQALNNWFNEQSGALPQGSVLLRYLSVNPLEPLVSGTPYLFTIELTSNVGSDRPREIFDVSVRLSSELWDLDPTTAQITLDNEGGQGELAFTVVPNAASNQCEFEVVARVRRNPTIRTTQPPLLLEIGRQPPVSAILVYAGPALNEAGRMELSAAQLTSGFGTSIGFILNNATDESHTYTLRWFISLQVGDEAGWSPIEGSEGQQDFSVSAQSTGGAPLNILGPTVGDVVGNQGTLHVALIRIDGTNLSPAEQETINVDFEAILDE